VSDPAETNVPAEYRPGAEWVLKDIDRSIDYRKKYYEYSVTIATALLAFSIAFPPTLTAIHYVILVKVAWVALGISVLCGVTAHFAWSKFFISFRDFDNHGHGDQGKLNRKRWTSFRRTMECVQFLCLLIGVMGIAIFAGVNYQYLALHTNEGNSPAKIVSPRP
jgi:H+/gluconate symporter-like permease